MPVRAHAEVELGIDPDNLTNPWHAALSSALAFTIGALLPLIAILLPPTAFRVPVTVVAVLAALAITGLTSARLGGAAEVCHHPQPRRRWARPGHHLRHRPSGRRGHRLTAPPVQSAAQFPLRSSSVSTFQGLPAHVLLVHFIVVLVPLTAALCSPLRPLARGASAADLARRRAGRAYRCPDATDHRGRRVVGAPHPADRCPASPRSAWRHHALLRAWPDSRLGVAGVRPPTRAPSTSSADSRHTRHRCAGPHHQRRGCGAGLPDRRLRGQVRVERGGHVI